MLGWECPVPDCRAVRGQMLSVKQDYTITRMSDDAMEARISLRLLNTQSA